MKKRSAHILKLRITSDDAQIRLVGKAIGSDADEQLGSYTAIINFDARSDVFSAWLVGPADKIGAVDAVHRRPSSGLSALSAREAEVLKHLALGEADKEIARMMEISTGTVKVHVKAIIRKLGVSNRTQAAIQALGQYPPAEDRSIDHAGDANGDWDTRPSFLRIRDGKDEDPR